MGKRIRLDDALFTVVGVTSPDFGGTANRHTDVWIPFGSLSVLHPLDASVPDLLTRADYCCSEVAGRLRPGIGHDQARAELDLLNRRFHQQFSLDSSDVLLTGTAALSNPGAKTTTKAMFALMFAGVTLILVLACTNVGNLLIARAAERQREIATRLSIGASRFRVIRQLLTEILVLTFVAVSLGLALAYVLPGYVMVQTGSDTLNLRVRPDASVLVFSVALSAVVSVLCGLTPALHATRLSLTAAIKEQAFVSRLRLRNVLLSVQVAGSVILIVGAGLVVRGVQRAYVFDPGFPIGAIDVISLDLSTTYTPARVQGLLADLRLALARLPNVTHGFARTAPFAGKHSFSGFQLPDHNTELIETQEVGGDYFSVLGLPIVAGRDFDESEVSRGTILINETMARRYLGETNAIGKTILTRDRAYEIVGIVKDAYTTGLDAIEPLVYMPLSGRAMPQALIRRSSGYEARAIADIAKRLDPRIETRVEPLAAQRDRYVSPARTAAVLTGLLGILALALASVGIFGVFAYVVGQRRHEIGIRMALGARPAQIIGLMLSASCRPVVLGLALGLTASAAASQVMRHVLFGLSPFDFVAYSGACIILGSVAIGATWVPVRRALRVDPVTALHYE